MIRFIRNTRRGSYLMPVTAAAVLLLAGCVSYSQAQLSTMNIVDLCELQRMQGPNLSQETKATMQGELQRRNDNCGKYSAELDERYAAFMYRETYGRVDNP